MRSILICTVACHLVGCCYGKKVLKHCFPIFAKELKICRGNANYCRKEIAFLIQIRFYLIK